MLFIVYKDLVYKYKSTCRQW